MNSMNDLDNMYNTQKNHVPKGMKKKKRPFLTFFIILLILAIAAGAVVFIYLKKKSELTPKTKFLDYLGKGSLTTVLNFENYNNLASRLQSESSESTSKITFSTTMDEINNIELKIDSKSDPSVQKNYTEIVCDYGENNSLTTNLLSNSKEIGIKSDEIVIKYIGSKYENLGRVLTDIFGSDSEYSEFLTKNNIQELINPTIKFPNIPENIISKYINIIGNNIDDNSITVKPVTLDRTSGKIDVTEYAISFNEDKALEIVVSMLQTLENDDELLGLVLGNYEEYGITSDLIKSSIDELINSLYTLDIDNSRMYTIKVYGADDKNYKTVIDISGMCSFDFDYEYGDKENSVTITMLETETQEGLKLHLKKSVSDV